MEHSEQIDKIAAALATAHLTIENPNLDKVNPHFKSKYASLGGHINAVRKILAQNGISVVQTVSTGDGSLCLTTTLLHATGQYLSDSLAFPMGANATAQAAGSLLTYMRRYSLAAMVGIVGEDDDDGNADREAGDRPAFKPTAAKGGMQSPPARKVAENGKDWPGSGITDCVFPKVQKRDKDWAVFADKCEFGGAWLRATNELGKAVEAAGATKRLEIEFRRAPDGALDLVSCRPAEPRVETEGSLI